MSACVVLFARQWFAPWWSAPCCVSLGVAQEPHSGMAVSTACCRCMQWAAKGQDVQTSAFCCLSSPPVMWSVSLLVNSQPPMASIIGGYLPAVCIEACCIQVTLPCVSVAEIHISATETVSRHARPIVLVYIPS